MVGVRQLVVKSIERNSPVDKWETPYSPVHMNIQNRHRSSLAHKRPEMKRYLLCGSFYTLFDIEHVTTCRELRPVRWVCSVWNVRTRVLESVRRIWLRVFVVRHLVGHPLRKDLQHRATRQRVSGLSHLATLEVHRSQLQIQPSKIADILKNVIEKSNFL